MGRNSNQRSRLLQLLIEARGAEVPLPQILDLKISQFGARLKELRSLGFDIENRQETRDGQRLSFYRLRLDSAPIPSRQNSQPKAETPDDALTLFDLGEPDRSYRE